MKLHGKTLDTPNEEIIVIPRGNGADIIFKAGAVLDYSRFEKLYPEPEAPKMKKAGTEGWVEDREDGEYLGAIMERNACEFNWTIYKSLQSTPGLEFDLITEDDPATWNLIDREFKESGFTLVEIGRITRGVLQANCLDERRVKEARESFMLSQESQPSA